MTSIASALQASTEAKRPLTALINKRCVPVGGIYRLDYDTAIVLTDDFKKQKAGGVPRGGFLLAVAGKNTEAGFVLEDQEIILLRVRGTAPLPNESELVQTRLAVVRDAEAALTAPKDRWLIRHRTSRQGTPGTTSGNAARSARSALARTPVSRTRSWHPTVGGHHVTRSPTGGA